MHAELATPVRALEQRSGQPINMVHWFRKRAFDVTGMLRDGGDAQVLLWPSLRHFAAVITCSGVSN
jgi:hypothetical protein